MIYLRQGSRSLAAAAALAIGAVASADAAPEAVLVPVQDRLELRSYQPYTGLQFDDSRRYVPPQRGLAPGRPEVVMPTRKSQVIRLGTPDPYTAQWYAYCSAKYLSFEPRTGLYTTFSGRKRTCR